MVDVFKQLLGNINTMATDFKKDKLQDKLKNINNEIVEQVGDMSELIEHVASASKSQLNSIENINSGIKEVSQVTHITTSSSEEAAAATEELSSQAETFKNLVGEFKLKKY